MKQYLLFLYVCVLLIAGLLPARAQMGLNAPTGLAPRQDMEIYTRNGFLVQQKYTVTTADPNTSINTLSCATSPPNLTAQAGILKDPGGDSNYPASLTCTQVIARTGSNSGYEVVFEDLDTEASNDLVTITDFRGGVLIFSGNTLPAPFFVAGYYFTVRFQSNNNATVGRGFRLRWREVYSDNTTPTTPNTAFGNALQFDANKGALMSGYLTTGAVQRAGNYSTALGNNTASGNYSTALGYKNTSNGYNSTTSGYNNTASGDYSTALGSSVSTNSQEGAFMIGDSDPLVQGVTTIGFADQFVGRFLNGYYLLTCGNTNDGIGTVRTGVRIGRGQNSWASISDSTKKERFRPINQADLLRKIGAIKLTTWNYKGQDSIRHYGPMAQDFYAAFGQDGLGQVGCDTLIYSHDFTGVTFAGVQALIRENERLQAETQHLASLLAQSAAQTNARLNQATARIEALEALLTPRRRGRLVAGK